MYYVFLLLITLLSLIFLLEMFHSLHRSNVNSRLIGQYRDDLQNPQLITDIYEYCQKDYKLRRIVKTHQLTPAAMEKIYKKLLLWGNFHKGSRFVPITSFLYAGLLEQLCRHQDDDAKTLTMKCMNFLHI